MRNQLFQEQALERLSSPEQLDRLMPLTSPRGWLALAAVGLLLVAGLAWSILGVVETTIQAEGLFTAPGAVEVVRAPNGISMSVVVKPGEMVQQGQTLAEGGGQVLKSPVAGRVLDASGDVHYTKDGASGIIDTGSTTVRMEIPNATLDAVAFVSAAEGYRVRPGMAVSIKAASDDPQSSSHLQGMVKNVGRTPATKAAVERLLQNESWTHTTLADGPVLQVNIEVPNLKPSERIFSGLPCTAQIVVERQRPIELVLPSFSQE